MSSVLLLAMGTFTLGLGLVHLGVPRIVGYGPVLSAAPTSVLPTLGRRRLRYHLRSQDLVGITWVMSNAASYVLVSIGIADLAWSIGWQGIPIGLGAAWIAGWWAVRAVGQFALGHRPIDVVIAAWFALLATGHVIVAVGL